MKNRLIALSPVKKIMTAILTVFVLLLLSLSAFATTISFEPQVTYGTGTSPYGLSVGDLDGDGSLDLVVPNNLSNTVSVLSGSGDGTFSPKTDYGTGSQPIRSVITDLNADGNPDVAVVNHCGGGGCDLYTYMGSEDGVLQAPDSYSVGSGPYDLLAGDYNNDGSQDIAVANGYGNTISFLAGNSSGDLQPAVSSASGGFSVGMTQGDLNGDGDLDLATANHVNQTVSILLGSGDGTFPSMSVINFPVTSRPSAIATTDLNDDTNLDLIVSSATDNMVYVVIGSGDGTFSGEVGYPVGTHPIDVAVIDLNADGRNDIVTANFNSDDISVLTQNAGGTYDATQNFSTGTDPSAVAVGDLNGDGQPDIAVSNYSSTDVSILLQPGPATTRYEETSGQISYKASCWNNYNNALLSGGIAKISKKKSCTAIFSYTGSKVEFISAKAKQLGKAKIYIDGVYQSTIDLYSSTTLAQQIVYTKDHGTSGSHTIKVEVLATKNYRASNSYILIDAFDVTD